jgi:hypothetical protein
MNRRRVADEPICIAIEASPCQLSAKAWSGSLTNHRRLCDRSMTGAKTCE